MPFLFLIGHLLNLISEPSNVKLLLMMGGGEALRDNNAPRGGLHSSDHCMAWKMHAPTSWRLIRGTQREYSSKPLKHSIVEHTLVFKQ